MTSSAFFLSSSALFASSAFFRSSSASAVFFASSAFCLSSSAFFASCAFFLSSSASAAFFASSSFFLFASASAVFCVSFPFASSSCFCCCSALAIIAFACSSNLAAFSASCFAFCMMRWASAETQEVSLRESKSRCLLSCSPVLHRPSCCATKLADGPALLTSLKSLVLSKRFSLAAGEQEPSLFELGVVEISPSRSCCSTRWL